MNEIPGVIKTLERKAKNLLNLDRALTNNEAGKLETIYRALPLLQQANDLFEIRPHQSNTLITYKIISDLDGKLKASARTACNFWNRFVAPSSPIVIRLGLFTSEDEIIAWAFEPYEENGIVYGVVEFNTRFLDYYSSLEVAGTIVHEIGHTLGMGWDDWMPLFKRRTGQFKHAAIEQLPSLAEMSVETDGDDGTRYAHWDEEEFGAELMTGYKDRIGEFVLPVTIDVMALLGHRISQRLTRQTSLDQLLREVEGMVFTRKEEAKALDLDYFRKTKKFEEIPFRR